MSFNQPMNQMKSFVVTRQEPPDSDQWWPAEGEALDLHDRHDGNHPSIVILAVLRGATNSSVNDDICSISSGRTTTRQESNQRQSKPNQNTTI